MTTTSSVSGTNNSSAAAIFAALNAGSAGGAGNSTATSSTAAQAQQDQFLTLLTAQLKNQDPLSPMDSSQMTSQMAQISTVDGITKLNTTLQSLLNNSQSTQGLQAATLLGHGVLVPGSAMTLASGQAVAGISLPSAADTVTVQINDANGLLVKTLNLGAQPAGVQGFTWDGTTDSGANAVAGAYRFTVKAVSGATPVPVTNLSFGTVSSVSPNTTGAQISVGKLGNFSLSDIQELL